MEATLISGDPTFADYTPSAGDISAGDVVVIGDLCGIAHLDISNTVLGALAIGGGIYDVAVAANYAAGSKVYWDDTNNLLNTTSTNNTPFGWTLEDATGANDVVQAFHMPF